MAFNAPRDSKRGSKTESLSLRVDPKTKFILEFLVRVTGFRITDLIERAIKEYAQEKTVPSFDGPDKNWTYYWHPDEGIRTINLIFDDDIHTTFEEDELKEFIRTHKEFFFSDTKCKRPFVAFVEVLWPNIDEYLQSWRETKSSNRWATGKSMMSAIRHAGMSGFEWPLKAKEELDDEIPF